MSTRNGSSITWTSYNLPGSLSASGYTASFDYAQDRSRRRQISSYSGSTETTIYVGGLLEKLTTGTRTHWKHLIPTPSGQVQVIRRSDGPRAKHARRNLRRRGRMQHWPNQAATQAVSD